MLRTGCVGRGWGLVILVFEMGAVGVGGDDMINRAHRCNSSGCSCGPFYEEET